MELTEIASDVHACIRPDRGLGWSNSGFINRAGGLVVDTFWDLPSTQRCIDLYAEVAPEPAVRLVNTHHNGDHCWGNQLYARTGAEIIGHRLCAEHMSAEIGPERLQAMIDADPADLPGPLRGFARALSVWDFTGVEITPPTTLIDEELALDLDGVDVRLLYVGPAHTAGDVIVHLPEEGVVFAGDILFHQCTPIGWEGTFDKWVEALELIASLAPETVVPGHGPLAGVDGVLRLRDYLQYVKREARAGFDAGLSPLDCARNIELGPPYSDWTEPERLVFNVHRAYREFRGDPWDTPVDTMAVFADVAALRAHLNR